jgi:sortase (surface protein transpeptidase)
MSWVRQTQAWAVARSKLYLSATGVVVFVISSYLLLAVFRSKPAPVPAAVTASTTEPDEQKPDKQRYVWQGQPDDPKYITLPTIQAEGFVQNVGVDQGQAVAVPNNIHMAGWFTESVRPGQPGLSILDGHVDGRRSDGVFKKLIDLKTNDEYTVELGGGTLKRFRVKKVLSVATKDAAGVLFSRDTKLRSQLNLITCGGTFDQRSRQYDQRVIVTSELIN